MLDKKSEMKFERALLHEMEKIKIAAHASGTAITSVAIEIIVARRKSQSHSLRLQYYA